MSISVVPSALERLPRYRRVDSYPPIYLGRPKERILTAIGRFDYLSAAQLNRLLFSKGSLTYTQDHVKQLFHAGFVRRVFLPTVTPHGSSLAVYCLDSKGFAYLKRAGQDSGRRFRPSEQADREWLFLRHTLAVNDLLIASSLLTQQRPSVTLARFKTEHELKRSVVYVKAGKQTIGVAPDGWIDLRPGDAQTCLAWELDRGTVERGPFLRKIAGLVSYVRGPYQEAFETQSLTVVFVTTAGERRLNQMLAWTEKVLTELDVKEQADLFRFAALDPSQVDAAELFLSPLFRRPFDAALLPLLPTGPMGD